MNIDSDTQFPQRIENKTSKQPSVDRAFQTFMKEALKEPAQNDLVVNFSNHAKERLEERKLDLTNTDLERITDAFKTLESKGSKNSLILYDDLALIASIKNKTVVTALKSEEMSEVTNIDSAIQINEKR